MKRFWTVFFSILLIPALAASALAAASSFQQYNPTLEKTQSGQIIWQLSGLGKATANPLWLPNNTLLVTSGKNLSAVTPDGKISWKTQFSGSGSLGQPLVHSDGTIFIPGTASLAQIRINGASGWKFAVYPASKGSKVPLGAFDPAGNLLYLPLADALYAFNSEGQNFWRLSPWDSAEKNSVRAATSRQFLAAAASQNTFYTIMGDKDDNFKLIAADSRGKLLWSYWLGEIDSGKLTVDSEGKCYVAVSAKRPKAPKSSSKSSSSSSKTKVTNIGKIMCLQSSSNQPLWNYSFNFSGTIPAPMVQGGRLYVSSPGHIWAFDSVRGALLWDNYIYNLQTSPQVGLNGYIYAGTSDNHLVSISPEGRMVWSRKLDAPVSYPVLAAPDGYIYVLTQKGSLYKIKDNYAAVNSR